MYGITVRVRGTGTVTDMEAGEVKRRPPFGDNPQVGVRGASTQRKILSAALDVFADHGFYDTRVELITEAAGCSRPAFYQYFASKEDVFWRLAGHMAREMEALAEGLGEIAPDEAGVGHLREWIDELIDLCTAYAPVLSSFQSAVKSQTETVKAPRTISERFGEALLDSVGREHPDLGVGSLATTTVTVVLRTIHYWGLGLGQIDRSSFVEGLAQTLHRLLHGPIPEVNASAVTAPPPRRKPAWPTFPGAIDSQQDLRPRGLKTRQRLLDAGSAILPQRGYHETRVDDIVASAGVSHGSFYRYFGNKDELFQVLAEAAAVTMVDLVSDFPEADDTAAVHAWLQGWFSTYRQNGGIISAWQEIGQDDPKLTEFSLDIAIVVLDRLRRIIHQRGFGDSAVDALVLLSAIERVPYSVLVLEYLDEPSAVEASTVIVQRGLLGRNPF